MKDQWSAQKNSKWDNIDLLLKIQKEKIYITSPILIIFFKSRAHFSFIFFPLQYPGLLKEWIISWGLHLAVVGFDMRTPSVFVCTHIFSTLLCMRKRVWTFVVGQSTFHHYYDVNLPATFLYYPSWEGPLPFCFLLPFLSPSPSIVQCCFCSLYCRLLPLLWGSWPCKLAMWRRISSFMQVGKLQVFIGHHIIWFPVTFLGCSTAFKREEEHSLHVKLLV